MQINHYNFFSITTKFDGNTTKLKWLICLIKEYLRLSSFELAFVLCESGALSTEPPQAGILTSCCPQYLSSPL